MGTGLGFGEKEEGVNEGWRNEGREDEGMEEGKE